MDIQNKVFPRKGVVKLNVGGVEFITYVQTLSEMQFFKTMSETDVEAVWLVRSEAFFLDRDSDNFKLILRYYRTPPQKRALLVQSWEDKLLDQIEIEASYYMADDLLRIVEYECGRRREPCEQVVVWRYEEQTYGQMPPIQKSSRPKELQDVLEEEMYQALQNKLTLPR